MAGGDLDGFTNVTPPNALASGTVSVGTTEVEAKAGGSRVATRNVITIYNDSSNTVYYGPTGVTTSGSTKGTPIEKNQLATLPIGDVGIFLIAGSASNSCIVQEYSIS